MPTDDELDDIYEECYQEDNIASGITDQLSPVDLYKELALFINTHLFVPTGAIRVLDYGSGTGGLLKELEKFSNSSKDIFEGVEYSQLARDAASKSFGKNVFYPSMPKRNYKLITMIEVIEHLQQPWSDLKKIELQLEVGGNLFITTPNLGGLNALLNGCKWREQNKPFHLIMFKRKFLRNILYDAGFNNVTFVKYFPVSSGSMIKKVQHKILQFFGLHGGLCVIATK
jgi:2-polyprenyl-3-methyl-5-hydroxy-6-metoxy-1,4-benzoquinol methylase